MDPTALVNSYKLTTSNGKHLEEVTLADKFSLMYKPKTSAKDTDDLSVGFDWDRGRRQRELFKNKNVKGKNRMKSMLRDRFSFAEHHEKAAYGLG